MRNRKRRKHRPAAQFCPIHHCLMKVRCVIDQRQYRYCPVDDCDQSARTERTKLPRPRQAIAVPASGNHDNNHACAEIPE
jgi:hypothetical protein